MEARKQIEVTKKVREEIMAAFGCSRMSVWRALNYEDNSPLSLRVRSLAFQKGGIELTILPTVETIHDCNKVIRQYFMNGAALEIDRNTGVAVVIDRQGNERMRRENVYMSELDAMQEAAKAL